MNKHKGFTVVELLIVIAVVGILTAIATISYGNIVRNAENTKLIYSLKAMMRGLQQYTMENSSIPRKGFPNASGWNEICLGNVDNYPAIPGQPNSGAGECGYLNYSPWLAKIGPDFMKEVAPYIGEKLSFKSNALWFEQRRGIRLIYWNHGGGENSPITTIRVEYILWGDVDCPIGTKDGVFSGNTRCTSYLTNEFQETNPY